jgi:hypothetical protein
LHKARPTQVLFGGGWDRHAQIYGVHRVITTLSILKHSKAYTEGIAENRGAVRALTRHAHC